MRVCVWGGAWFAVHLTPVSYACRLVPSRPQLSGTYYVTVPPGAGNIVFRDPRGALPPFEHTFHHAPRNGDMLVFPSWLVHEVAPTQRAREQASAAGSKPQPQQLRIAVSFNLAGDWDSTSDVSVAFPA